MSGPHRVNTATGRRPARSVQQRLMVAVLSIVLVVWGFAFVATWYDTEHEVGELLDAHLSLAATLLLSQPLDALPHAQVRELPNLHDDQRRVVMQVWHDDQLVLKSVAAPHAPMVSRGQAGFAQVRIGQVDWRVFSVSGYDGHVVVQVAEQVKSRRDVVLANLRSVAYPMFIALPLLVMGVWMAVRHALRPLYDLGQRVTQRSPDDSAPLPDGEVPAEVQALVGALNRLFGRMARMIESERRFTADAAHELRTPLAAVRMQAQVAQGALDDAERDTALAAVVQGCDRAAHLVDQLLQLARLENQVDVAESVCSVRAVARSLGADLSGVAEQRGQELRWSWGGAREVTEAFGDVDTCPLPEGLLRILLRNLVDNALRYSPAGAKVHVSCLALPEKRASLCIEDSGPGLPPDAVQRLGERFFRVVGSGQPGSGLGWSIVRRIAAQYGLGVSVGRSQALGGLSVTVSWVQVDSERVEA